MALDFMNYSFNFIQRSIHLCSILLMLFKAQFSYVEKSPYYKLWQIFSILGRVAIFAHFHEIFVHSCEFLKTALVLISLSLVHLYLWDFCYGDLQYFKLRVIRILLQSWIFHLSPLIGLVFTSLKTFPDKSKRDGNLLKGKWVQCKLL